VPALQKYGMVVVHVWDQDRCQRTIAAMFEDINAEKRHRKGDQWNENMKVSVDDPKSWESKNFPSSRKFLLDWPAFHQQAFRNRVEKNVYTVFTNIFGTHKLWSSIDNWGIARGTKFEDGVEYKKWRYGLKPHWDYNPWLWVKEVHEDQFMPAYQAVVALVDQPLEVGVHLTLPGCTRFLPTWCKERTAPNGIKRVSHRPEPIDEIIEYMQKIPVRQGDMIIWSWGQLHGTTENGCSQMRLSQYVRMFPATTAYELKDKYACRRILRQKKYQDFQLVQKIQSLGFNESELCLLGVRDWDEPCDDQLEWSPMESF